MPWCALLVTLRIGNIGKHHRIPQHALMLLSIYDAVISRTRPPPGATAA
jgi:hypothetical protein